jgi:DUF1680 family protein
MHILQKKLLQFFCLVLALSVTACGSAPSEPDVDRAETEAPDYPIQPVDIRQVKLTDEFWLPVIQRVQEKTIEFAIEKCREEGRFENFLIAGGEMEGATRGFMPFDDTDVYKTIEGMSNSLISSPNQQMETLMDSLISIIARGQEEDGYLTTWRTINPARPPASWVKVDKGVRWESLEASHELYNAGHLYEAAAVHHQATGKNNFLDIATKNADLMVNTFGPGKIETVPGHQVIETGLIKLYRITGKNEYLDLARYFLDGRGDSTKGRRLFGPYSQDHIPVTEQREVVGHAVRAVYMYAGMTDIAALQGDEDYLKAVKSLWENMVSKKMYITGGIGARHEGESFGENYELPNLTAYSETCAAIGSVYWNHRLFMLTGESSYYDVIERTLYNGLISGLSLDGENFFYPNALEADGKYEFNIGKCTRQSWFDCSCCPTNLIRFIPSIPGLIYAQDANTLFVNLYVSSEASLEINGRQLQVTQNTNYPWDGEVNMTFSNDSPKPVNVKLRIPAWVRGEVLPGDLYGYDDSAKSPISLSVNEEDQRVDISAGYVSFSVEPGTSTIQLLLPMSVQRVKAHESVEDDRNKIALEYGPIVYAVEEVDNQEVFDQISIQGNESFEVRMQEDLLGGVNVITAGRNATSFTAIPYYAWSNRGIGKMKVWLPQTASTIEN